MKIIYVLPVAMCLLWSSCIRDTVPPCPPLQVTLTVKDKNYFNIDDAVKLGLMERKAENLPFRDYVSVVLRGERCRRKGSGRAEKYTG